MLFFRPKKNSNMSSTFKNFLNIKSKFFSNILKIIGICSACVVIQACYGTPKADYEEMGTNTDINGVLKTEKSLSPAPGTRVLLTNSQNSDTLTAFTDNKGSFSFTNISVRKNPYLILVKDKNNQLIASENIQLNKTDALNHHKNIEIKLSGNE